MERQTQTAELLTREVERPANVLGRLLAEAGNAQSHGGMPGSDGPSSCPGVLGRQRAHEGAGAGIGGIDALACTTGPCRQPGNARLPRMWHMQATEQETLPCARILMLLPPCAGHQAEHELWQRA